MATKVWWRRSYEEFEPLCEWGKDECSKTVDLHLQGFQKEQMKVMINNAGILSITGERPLEGNKWRRFRKEIKVPDDIKTSEIRAKLTSGVLRITMPIKPPQAPPHDSSAGINENSGKKCIACLRRLSTSRRLAVVTLLVLAGAYCFSKYYQRRYYIEN
ncbi:hypothetical protein SLEP1_g19337 [Rubroshorea leprosula]|nr:hypothetical protein SLEP1_g19337 [Rubroshorea leprosula]